MDEMVSVPQSQNGTRRSQVSLMSASIIKLYQLSEENRAMEGEREVLREKMKLLETEKSMIQYSLHKYQTL